jgi:Ca-activated chloride channel homolog
MQKTCLLFLFQMTFGGFAIAQSAHKSLRSGDEAFDNAKYENAEKAYQQALKKSPGNNKATYNLGNSMYRQGKYEDAANLLTDAAKKAQTPAERADAYHNLGNAQMQLQKYDQAVQAYQNSLRNRPGDAETKQNLQMALRKKQEQQQQQQQQEQQKKDQQQQEQNKNQDQNQQDQKDQQNQDQNQPQQNQQNKDQNQQQQQQQQSKPSTPLTQSQEQLLKYIDRQDREIKQRYQEKTTKTQTNRNPKDW